MIHLGKDLLSSQRNIFCLGEELLAQQMFMPGIPQVWYLDILRVKNNEIMIMVVVQVIKKLIGQL
jgi:hypothetical protein